jgi:prepilin-type N-terminal cleavage/methylation domain-containing protein
MKKFKSNRNIGFTLIELMGVMAIIGILAAVTLPSLIGKIESARIQSEDANLEEIARALVEGIKKQGQFPDPALANGTTGSWTDIAQNFTSLGANALANVLPNNSAPDNNPRRIIFSDDLTTYLGGIFPQSAAGRSAPPVTASLIIYILSSSKNGVPLSTGVIPPADIANWNKAFDANLGYIPAPTSVFGAGNVSKGEFLHVKAVNIRPLLCRVDLHEYPYPLGATTQSAYPGAGFIAGTSYKSAVGAFLFSFLAPATDFNDPATGNGTPVSSIAVSGTKSQITRSGVTSTTMTGTIGGGDEISQFDITVINPPPQWDISPPTTVSAQSMPTVGNTQTLYVIKGTSLSLYASGAAAPGALILTVQINADSSFQYCNGAWTRVD